MKYVDKNANLKKLQKEELTILKYFDSICKKHHLEYFMGYGTLLGAVRHKGFIPWDDDIDVLMKGDDYLKLAEILKNNIDDNFFFQSPETEKNYYLIWNKIRKNNTYFAEKGWEKNKIHQGIFVDIFTLIEYPDNKKDLRKISFKYKIANLLGDTNIYDNYHHKYKTYGSSGKILWHIFRLIPRHLRMKLITKNVKYLCNYHSNSEYYFISDVGMDVKIKKADFKKSIDLKFEDSSFKAPIGYDSNLKDIFGDYMKLPKEEDRVGHGEVYLCFNTLE